MPSLSAAVLTYLNKRSMIGTTVTVSSPTYVPINIALTVTVDQRFRQDIVVASVNTAITALFNFALRSFGETMSYTDVWAAVKALQGVSYITMSLYSRTVSGLGDVVLAVNEIATLTGAAITVTPVGGVVPS